MNTLVTIQAAGGGAALVDRAFDWFRRVEACCSRFDPASELMQLTARAGTPVQVSVLLFQAVQFATALAKESGGAFDPTVGHRMEMRGFNREHRTGTIVRTTLEPDGPIGYGDVALDPDRRTVTLLRPLILDLGAVAKGLAIDMAARELRPVADFAIDAGGDLYLAGCRPDGAPWSVGIRHPRADGQVIRTIHASDLAVCTSGDYERRLSEGDDHHIMDPRTGKSATAAASATVVAPTAMLADGAATAAFVMGPARGIALCDRLGVNALLITPDGEQHSTRGMFGAESGG